MWISLSRFRAVAGTLLLYSAMALLGIGVATAVLLDTLAESSRKNDKLAAANRDGDASALRAMAVHGALAVGYLSCLLMGAFILPTHWYVTSRFHWSTIPRGERLWFGGGVGLLVYAVFELWIPVPAHVDFHILIVGPWIGMVAACISSLSSVLPAKGKVRPKVANIVGWVVSLMWFIPLTLVLIAILMRSLGIDP